MITITKHENQCCVIITFIQIYLSNIYKVCELTSLFIWVFFKNPMHNLGICARHVGTQRGETFIRSR